MNFEIIFDFFFIKTHVYDIGLQNLSNGSSIDTKDSYLQQKKGKKYLAKKLVLLTPKNSSIIDRYAFKKKLEHLPIFIFTFMNILELSCPLYLQFNQYNKLSVSARCHSGYNMRVPSTFPLGRGQTLKNIYKFLLQYLKSFERFSKIQSYSKKF